VTGLAGRTTLSAMRPSEALSLHRTRIREIALSHRVSGVRVFGSALLGKDGPDSDLDLLVEPTAQTTLLDIGAIRHELKNLLGMEVDVLTPNGLPPKFREQVLREAVPV
jgi:predicted nucleotidyltransferase